VAGAAQRAGVGPATGAAAAPTVQSLPSASASAAAARTATLHLAISPWGQVEVDGEPVGTAPPLSQLALSEGAHSIVVRNADFAPYRATVQVQAGQSLTLRHRFTP
jgi:eukaryotic-like serine/threonine-protein kinase